MSTVIIQSSPRLSGNGAYLADKLAEKYPGALRVNLAELSYKGCLACGACRKNNTFCTQKDDLAAIFPKLAEASLVILISPSFMGFINGEAKQFTDRLYCMRTTEKMSRFQEGAKFGFLFTQGSHNRDKGSAAVNWMKGLAENFRLKYFGMAVPGCEKESLDGVKLKEQDIMMSFSFLM